MSRTTLNFWVNFLSFLVLLGLVVTGGLIHYVLPAGTGRAYALFGLGRHDYGQIHFYFAVGALAILTVHVWLHWRWVCSVVGKAFQNAQPARTTRTLWGILLVALLALGLGLGLWWVSGRVTTRGEADGRDESEGYGRNQRRMSATEDTQRASSVNKSAEDCPAGLSITGQTTLREAATICGISVQRLADQLKISKIANPEEKLGPLKRQYGFDIHDVRRLACR